MVGSGLMDAGTANFFELLGASAPAPVEPPSVAALYVEADGVYANLPGVEVYDRQRDARRYRGPHPVVAHPPCSRWGRYAEYHPMVGDIGVLGDDDGCFAHALWAVRSFGGVLEHPKESQAWAWFGLMPPLTGGWQRADDFGGYTCCIEQCHYGHAARKPTWLYAAKVELPSLPWGRGKQRLHEGYLAKHGYEKARRAGIVAMAGGKDKVRIREATPEPLRDLLISIARTGAREEAA